jgi:hypothetical protein
MQQKKSTSRGKSADSQRRPAARSGQTMLAVPPGSGEVTFGGVADRGLTLAAFYESGVLERLRLEVRVRLIMDLTLSLAWLHENPRLMAAYSHLRITPSTVVIGLDGVARVDVRAAKKRSSELADLELEYLAPELSLPEGAADHRADLFSLGVLAWEALAGRRLFEGAFTPTRPLGSGAEEEGDVPAALASIARADRERRKTLPRGAKASHSRLRLAPPPLSLPAGGEWALPLLEIAMQAMNLDVSLRPRDCRSVLERLSALDGAHLAAHQEIAEVVQGISGVNTLCTPEPRLPNIDASCQDEAPASRPRPARGAACSEMGDVCANPAPPAPRVQPTFEPAPALPSPVPQLAAAERERTSASPGARNAWFWVGLLWLATAGLLAGYVTSVMAHR